MTELSNDSLFGRARRVIPGGVNSPVRAFGSVGGTPFFVAGAAGGALTDVEGRTYVDLVSSYGAVILGHAHPAVTEAVAAAAASGTSYGTPTEREVLLAEEICGRVPSCEQLRLVSSGTEATMSAIRLARGITGRSRVVKFAGNYHGHADALLAAGGSGVATLGLVGSDGVPEGAVADTIVAPYNVVPELDEQVAAVIVEPVAANMGVVAPVDGFLEGLRRECDRVGAVLIFDEVITGFRLAEGGAQAVFGVTPDLTCFGKVIGGGLPIGAFGGRAALMEGLAPLGPVYQAGTLSGNPLATAAGLAVLGHLSEGFFVGLEERASAMAGVLRSALVTHKVPATVAQVGTLVGLSLGEAGAPIDYDTARRTDEAAYARFFHGALDAGVFMAPGAYEAIFASPAHTDSDLETVAAAFDAGAEAAAGA